MKKLSLTQKVVIAMIFGAIVGLGINILHLNKIAFVQDYLINGLFFIIGKMFISALKMLVAPLVLFSLITGVLGIGDIKELGKVGVKTFLLYLLTTAVAIAIAITLAASLHIGEGLQLTSSASFSAKEAPSLTQVLINIIPTNIFNALSHDNMLQIIFFAILFGISIIMVGVKAKPLVDVIEIVNEAMMKMVTIIMATAPIAVFALIAKAFATLGLDLFAKLLEYVIVLLLALALHLFITQMGLLKLFGKVSVKIFLNKAKEMQLFAFSTSSSNATIPVTMRVVTQKMGIDNSVASFTIPFGATINMDGTAIMQGVATVFIANVYGVDLGLSGYLTVILMATLASIGTAGVPGVGLVMLSMVFTQVNLPLEGIGLILGVDRLLDMARTVINVTGDAVVTLLVAKSEKKFNKAIFDNPNAGILTDDAMSIDEKTEKELQKEITKLSKK